ncbi:hypothetical protein B446_11595 [Streptomyces collinus Tu 365]|uniref:Uncharacterized protein n=1 Tax=Streptomyces collinus (strain DSM 40733 / Tue 365) TaxID=1214242 RepID=S5UTF9_STRC3|nr:hypothetical protein B446_11595 [Streptomyces collinus Tu 365]
MRARRLGPGDEVRRGQEEQAACPAGAGDRAGVAVAGPGLAPVPVGPVHAGPVPVGPVRLTV